ncbi:SCP2 sterol-binding domain-containing protein [Actinomadura atramentaria]|uniref:SCP2 sterol-binding domain-containing protein n=1 Tax=Actinomadura atramentaria TaxID=1990 RepID=UPI00037A30FE|nr:SCP2 sterol-binding domain-containing protein [Actinomadura atramentaria]
MTETEPRDGGLAELVGAVGTPAELRALLELPGVDEAVVEEFAAAAGTAEILDRLFALMAARLLPAKAGRRRGTVRWDVRGPDGDHVYALQIAEGRAEASRGAPDSPKAAFSVRLPDLLRLCAGTLNGVTAVMTGRIRVTGDLLFAARLQGWFDYH